MEFSASETSSDVGEEPHSDSTEESLVSEALADLFAPSENRKFNGAVAIVATEDGISYRQGFGFEDLATSQSVDPSTTRFRVASVTKTFAAVALGQLVDRGLIKSVDDPVNDYLKRYKLPDDNGVPRTLRHILTHAVGYEDRFLPLYQDVGDFPDLDAKYLSRIQPNAVQPAGTASVYSNFGSGLAGVIVEDITGMSFASYLEQFIFSPLGMSNSVLIDQPRSIDRMAQAQSYYPDGSATKVPNEWSFPPVTVRSGGLVTTGEDMGAYIQGLLRDRSDGGLLGAAGRSFVFTRLGGNHPKVDGFSALFFTGEWNGVTHFGHTGYMPGFRANLIIVPEMGYGVFAAVTGEPGRPGPGDLVQAALGRGRLIRNPDADFGYPPGLASLRDASLAPVLGTYQFPKQANIDANELPPLDEFIGSYRDMRRSSTRLTKAFETLFRPGLTLTVQADGKGGLAINGRGGFEQVEAGVFWRDASVDKGASGFFDVYAFVQDTSGRVQYVTYQYGNTAFEPMPWDANPAIWRPVYLAGTALLIIGAISGAFYVGRERRFKLAPLFGSVAGLLAIATPFLFFRSFADVEDLAYQYLFALPQQFLPFVASTNVFFVACVGVILSSPVISKQSGLSYKARSLPSLLGASLMIGSLLNFNLIGVNLP